jgi:hypothetical protein
VTTKCLTEKREDVVLLKILTVTIGYLHYISVLMRIVIGIMELWCPSIYTSRKNIMEAHRLRESKFMLFFNFRETLLKEKMWQILTKSTSLQDIRRS